MTLNNQKIEPDLSDQTNPLLDVHSIWSTIQGEGPFAGMPAIFVRFFGCTLKCPRCDTDYTSSRTTMSPDDLLSEILSTARHAPELIVFTGGEPFRQPHIALEEFAYKSMTLMPACHLQIETNGTIGIPEKIRHYMNALRVSITLSPKTSTIDPSFFNFYSRPIAWKYILEDGLIDSFDGLPTRSLGYSYRPARPPEGTAKQDIFIQPFDSHDDRKNIKHLNAAVSTCLRHGYRLSLQQHKMLGLK